jgi:hypothetical protein
MLSTSRVAGRNGRRAALLVGAIGLSVAGALPASASTTTAQSGTSHLLGLSVESHSTYDRVILNVSGIPGYTVTPTDELVGAASGKDITLPNSNTYLDVELHPADTAGFSGPTEITTGDPEVAAVAELTSFESYVQVGIGLNHASSYTVTVLSPTQLAIDVAH